VRSVLMSLAQMLLMTLGAGLSLVGAARFLRAWLTMGWVVDQGPGGFLRASSPFQHVRAASHRSARWARAWALMTRVARLPGLGELLLGLGLTVLAGQGLEPDPTLSPDPKLMTLGWFASGLGGLQWLWRRRRRGP